MKLMAYKSVVVSAVFIGCVSSAFGDEERWPADTPLPSDRWVLVGEHMKLRDVANITATIGGAAIAVPGDTVARYPYFTRELKEDGSVESCFNVQMGIVDSGWYKAVDVLMCEKKGNIYARRYWLNYGGERDFATDEGLQPRNYTNEADSVYAVLNLTCVKGEAGETILNATTNLFGACFPLEYGIVYDCCVGLTLDQLAELAEAGCVRGLMSGPSFNYGGEGVCCFPTIEENDGRRELILQFQRADDMWIKCVVLKFFEDEGGKSVIHCSRLWCDYYAGAVGSYDVYKNAGFGRGEHTGYNVHRLIVSTPYEIPKATGMMILVQ